MWELPPPYDLVADQDSNELHVSEELPRYWCHVHLEGWLPIKMEASDYGGHWSSGTWKLRYAVLHGTALRIYSPSSAKNRACSILEGGRRLSDHTMDAGQVHIHPGPVLSGLNLEPTSIPTYTPAYPKPSRRKTMSFHIRNILDGHLRLGRSMPRCRMQVEQDHKDQHSDLSELAGLRRHMQIQEGLEHHFTYARPKVSLDKTLTLQHAQLGLADDVYDRKNVLRMRAQGEQFLLDAQSVEPFSVWSTALQAAIGVSLDLDIRRLPSDKGLHILRRNQGITL